MASSSQQNREETRRRTGGGGSGILGRSTAPTTASRRIILPTTSRDERASRLRRSAESAEAESSRYRPLSRSQSGTAITTPSPRDRLQFQRQVVPASTPRLFSADRSRAAPLSGPNTPKAPSNVSSSVSVDPFILDFGTSVNVNEDLRRTLRMEIQSLDDSINQRKAILREEESTEAQFRKDLYHAQSEMHSLSRGASDQLENARVHDTFLVSLEKQLNSEIVECITGDKCSTVGDEATPGRPTVAHDHHQYHSVTPNPNEESQNRRRSESNSDTVFTYGELLKNKETRVADLLETLKNEKKELQDIREQAGTLKAKHSQLEQVIRDQGLEDALKKAQEEASRRQVELEKDRGVYQAAQADLNMIQDECGAGAKELVELDKHLNELRKETAMEESQRAEQIEAAKARVEDLKNIVAAKKGKKKELDDQLEKFKAASDSFQAFRQAQEEHNAKMAERKITREEMLETLKRIEEQLVAATERKNASIDRLARAQKAKEASNELKAANDDLEQTVILPGKEQMKQLAEAKEALALKITEFHKTSESDRAKEKDTLEATEERKKALKAQVDQLTTDLQSKEEEYAALDRMQEDFKEKNRERVASHNAQEKIYEEASKYTEKEIELRNDEYRAKKEDDLRDFVSKSELECLEKEKLNEILEKGIDMIRTTRKVENVGQGTSK